MKFILLCGGRGSRLGSLTDNLPKPLQIIDGIPFIEIIIREIKRQGFSEILLLCGYLGKQFEYLVDKYNVEISYEKTPLGTGGQLLKILDSLPDRFVVMNGDTYGQYEFQPLIEGFQNATAVRYKRAVNRYDWIDVDSNDVIVGVSNRDSKREGFINSGVYLIQKSALSSFKKSHRNEVMSLENDFFPFWTSKYRVYASRSYGSFIDIGIPSDLSRASIVINEPHQAIFLDRDGVLIKDTGHPFGYEQFEYNTAFLDELSSVHRTSNVEFFIMTNQAGIARGLFTESAFKEDMFAFCDVLETKFSIPITKFYYCPHHPSIGNPRYCMTCDCRKPSPGMLNKAIEEFKLDRSQVTFVGDRITDEKAALSAYVSFNYIKFN